MKAAKQIQWPLFSSTAARWSTACTRLVALGESPGFGNIARAPRTDAAAKSMRIPRVYQHPLAAEGAELRLGEVAARHVQAVLRLKPGAAIVIFDGLGHARHAQLLRATRNEVTVLLGNTVIGDVESVLQVTVALGVSRGERMDLAVQKSVELGVARIVPLLTEHTVVKLNGDRADRRLAHWRGVIIGACEQCGRDLLPQIDPVYSLADWLQQLSDDDQRLMPDPRAECGLRQIERMHARPITLLIGPEGGISAAERTLAQQHGFTGVRLGPRVLRTETAVIAAMSAVMTLWGDLGD
jgi:16S rRNA (uracil1498-N3)-methyltransferase